MNANSLRILGFSSILFISSLFYTGLVLDFTLGPRFFILSVLLSLFMLIGILSKNRVDKITITGLGLVLLSVWSLASWLWATNPAEIWFPSIKWICATVVFFIASSLFSESNRTSHSISRVAAVLTLVSSLFVLLQLNEITLFNIQGKQAEYLYYITGVNSHKNLASSFIFILFPFLFISDVSRSKFSTFLQYGIAAVAILAILLLKTRAVWIALFVTGLVFFSISIFTYRHKLNKILFRAIVVMSFFMLIVGIAVGAYFIQSKMKSVGISNADSLIERLQIWKNTLFIIRDNPVLGVGAGNWPIHFPEYSLDQIWRCDEMNVSFQRPHNDFLWTLSELGIVGLLIQMTIYGNVLFTTMKRVFTFKNIDAESFRTILFISFYIGGGMILNFDFPNERAEHLLWMAVGLAFLDTRANSFSLRSIHFPFHPVLKVGALMLMLFCGYISFLRIKGEYYTKKLYQNRTAQNETAIIDNALKARSFAYSLDPVSQPLMWYVGNGYTIKGQYPQALGFYKIAYRQNPFSRYLLNDLGTCYLLLNNSVLAEKYYMEASRISPRYDDPLLNMIAMRIQQGRWEDANELNLLLMHDSDRRTSLEAIIEREGFLKK